MTKTNKPVPRRGSRRGRPVPVNMEYVREFYCVRCGHHLDVHREGRCTGHDCACRGFTRSTP